MSNTVPMTFREIEQFDDPCLTIYLDLYETAFPAEERIPVSNFVEVLLAKQQDAGEDYHLLIATVTLPTQTTEYLAVMSRIDVDRDCDLAYLISIAVIPRLQGEGYGDRMIEEILQRLKNDPAPVAALLVEVDDPDKYEDEEDREIAEEQVEFYRGFGARYLDGIEYIKTVAFYPEGSPMKLGFIPLRNITPEEAFAAAECLLGETVKKTGNLAFS